MHSGDDAEDVMKESKPDMVVARGKDVDALLTSFRGNEPARSRERGRRGQVALARFALGLHARPSFACSHVGGTTCARYTTIQCSVCFSRK